MVEKFNHQIGKKESSVIREIEYHPERSLLEIRIEPDNSDQSRVYLYQDVPKAIYKEFINANSKGKYFNSEIKNKFEPISA